MSQSGAWRGRRAARLVAASLVLAAGQGVALGQVAFKSNPDVARPVMTAAQKAQALIGVAARSPETRLVVQFERPILDEEREALAAAGVELLNFLGNDAYFARTRGMVNALRVAQAAPMSSVREIRPEWKLHPMINRGEIAAWTVVSAGVTDNPTVAVNVMFHKDVSREQSRAILEGIDGLEIMGEIRSVHAYLVEMPWQSIRPLGSRDQTMWIEPAAPPLDELNDSNRVITQVNDVQAAPYSLDGSGVTVLVYDGGNARASHSDFSGRVTTIDSSGVSSHPTHVSATIGGDGTARGDLLYRGMAPGVSILSAGLEQEGGLRQGFLYTDPCDIEEDYGLGISLGAVIANNSIGTNTAPNGFPCDWEGDYSVTDSVIDEIVRGSVGGPIIIVWSNGNERGSGRCGTQYHTTAPPATAKNHITVGALNSNDDSMTSFSSWGDTDDGRMKPDVSAPGCQSGGDGGVTSASSSSDTSYTVFCGTSMSGPTVAGIVALMLEDFRAQFPGLPDPLGSTVKVILAQTAQDRGNPGPDNQFGYGSVRAKNAIDFLRTAQFTEQPISTGAVHTFEVEIAPGTAEMKYTLSWADPAGTPLVDPALVNNLDIRAIDPSGGTHFPWTLSHASPGNPAVRTGPNSVDNIEQVFVQNPQAGTWTIEVVGTSVPEGPQVYSLAGSPSLDVSLVAINLASALPDLQPPATPLTVQASVTAINDLIVPGTEMMHYRLTGGAFIDVPLTPLGGNLYEATIPGASCAQTPEFYFSVEGVDAGLVFGPGGGPASPFSYPIGTISVVVDDNFESNNGWTTSINGATSGQWERGVPVNDGSWAYDPPADGDGSGQCWLTQNAAGNTDVDGGSVTLTSPAFDLSGGGDTTIEYDYYLNMTDPSTDRLLVEMSTNGGSTWTTIATHQTDGGLSWRHHTISQSDLDNAGIVLSAQTHIRYTANDSNPQSIVEAGVDGLKIAAASCDDVDCPADIDGDGDADGDDFFGYLDLFAAGDPDADLDGDGDRDADDFFMYLDFFALGC